MSKRMMCVVSREEAIEDRSFDTSHHVSRASHEVTLEIQIRAHDHTRVIIKGRCSLSKIERKRRMIYDLP